MTLHRLLRQHPGNSTRFRHHRGNRLPHDLVVVDETSMVSLTMMARLLEAVRPEARLVLVGDPDQLSSVDAGAVLTDLVRGYHHRADNPVAALTTTFRYGEEIRALAEALRLGDADAAIAVLRRRTRHVEWVTEPDPASAIRATVLPARPRRCATRPSPAMPGGPSAVLDRHRLLCAHRDGPYGVRHWNRRVEQWLTEETGRRALRLRLPRASAPGHANDYVARRLQRRHRRRRRRARRTAGRHRRRRRRRSTWPPRGSARSRRCTR